MNSIQNKNIAIVGGGPGGLTLARLLQMNGITVKVYERDAHKDARAKGATLDLHEESGLLALKEAGLMSAFLANYRPGADQMRMMNEKAEIVFDDHANQQNNRSRPEIDRGPLQNILLDSLAPGTVIWDSHFSTMTPDGDGWQLNFRNGTVANADVVIAADGANSKLRAYVTPIKPFYSGVTAVEGAVYKSAEQSPHIHKLLSGGKIFAFGDSKSLIVSSKGDGSLVFYTSFNIPEDWITTSAIDFANKAQVTDWFKKEYAGWDNSWLELFENAVGNFIPRPLYCMPLDQTWQPLPNLTMLGDAAHLMPPFAGEGVNMAMLDALELSQNLLSDHLENTHAAIADYESEMRRRASEMAEITMQSTEALHSPGAIDFMLRVMG